MLRMLRDNGAHGRGSDYRETIADKTDSPCSLASLTGCEKQPDGRQERIHDLDASVRCVIDLATRRRWCRNEVGHASILSCWHHVAPTIASKHRKAGIDSELTDRKVEQQRARLTTLTRSA